MRCDTSGAGYAIFWANVDGKLVVAGDYVTDKSKEELKSKNLPNSFAEESESHHLDANGDGYLCSPPTWQLVASYSSTACFPSNLNRRRRQRPLSLTLCLLQADCHRSQDRQAPLHQGC